MKKFFSVFRVIISVTVFFNFCHAKPDYVFSVSSNPSFNLGIKLQKLVLFAGTDFNYDSHKTNSLSQFGSSDNYSVFSVSPGLGLKYYFSENDIVPFLTAVFIKELPVFISNKSEITNEEIEDNFDDYSYRFAAGADFKIKESLWLGFELGAHVFINDFKTDILEFESKHILTFSSVTLTYVF